MSAVAVAGVLVSIAAPIVIVAVLRRKKNFIAGQGRSRDTEVIEDFVC